ncbi:PQQ-binding-like beta-propeller repeat protein [Lentimicrobium sp. S6]|uniref:outer membrane protein assembly factor BamB family protein n=1 Tax=Lentimicrobium sp. S6 TaxID=2735872 RepID=UPI001553C5F4|nr:PQQ-binding-like beta-propeller repeat protein [Lentimicrobium sp. S6]NPD47456.1 PQQ-binding-like beta-propeller repeat protein [Lentimicrobium sp. S6]
MKNSILLIAMLLCMFHVKSQQNPFVQWSFETNGKILSHPIIDEEGIYFGSNDSIFYRLDLKTGQQIWNLKTKSSIQSKALINKDMVYFKSGNDVFALHKDSGEQVWCYSSKDKQGSSQIDPWDYHSGAPAIFNSIIYFGLGNGELKGFDLKTGEIKQEILRTDTAAIKSGLIIENSILYFGDWNGKVDAYNLATGEKLWEHKTYEKQLYNTFGQINTQLTINNDLLFFGMRNPEMQVLDKNTGEKKWNYIEKAGGWISGDPLVHNDTLFIGGSDNHEMLAFNANTGEKYWAYLFLNNNFSKPLAYKNSLLFTTGDAYNVYGTSPGRGYLYALNKSDGSLKNFTTLGGNIYSSLLVANDMLYMGSANGNLYALDLDAFLHEKPNLKTKGYNSVEILDVTPSSFSDTLNISYEINYNTIISIQIKDLNEDEVIELYSGKINKGEHLIKWDGTDSHGNNAQDGYYFLEINSSEYYKKTIIQKQIPDNETK